ncbi:MAG: hypothetical protein A3H98_01670 [Bacteroidetes bacterium RIFCSPLOWO2_02_FULL_36_8]|nr:MAG: hypothetical protein A3H98_01670 [Bacteroidetes bacterium RIFCSPLOWO2_02_FULL_36_8]OFY69364.1 MAG: hypothetical protein A3G23_01005 [Bacteroidetes bacterium RIFCSPLOWO2_12_FULL_37_12]
MSDDLIEIISTLKPDEHRSFRVFINHRRGKKERKDLALFDFLVKNKKVHKNDLYKKFYPESNQNAYHTLRKRLVKHLISFIALKNIEEDTTNRSFMLNLVSLSQYLFRKKRNRMAWKILSKAEKLAIKTKEYLILDSIYYEQIEKSGTEFSPPLQSILDKKNKNRNLAVMSDKANTINQLLRHRMSEFSSTKKNFNLNELLNEELLKNVEDMELGSDPKFINNVISVFRATVIAGGDYLLFEKFVLEKYHTLEEMNRFDRYNHYYKLNILYIISHTFFRNFKFEESLNYLDQLYRNMLLYNKVHFEEFNASYLILISMVYAYSGNNNLAIQILEQIVSMPPHKLEIQQRTICRLNLAVLYHQVKNYHKAIQVLMQISHTDKWMKKNFGKYNALKKQVVECIIHHDNGNLDFVETRLRFIQKSYSDLLNHPEYEREKLFFRLFRKLNTDPNVAEQENFQKDLVRLKKLGFRETLDLQIISFYAWLESKVKRGVYYDTLIELIGREKERYLKNEIS